MTQPWTATVLTIFPEMFPGPLGHSLAGHALARRPWRSSRVDIRGHSRATGTARSTTRPFGGGPGMVMRAGRADAALGAAIDAAPKRAPRDLL